MLHFLQFPCIQSPSWGSVQVLLGSLIATTINHSLFWVTSLSSEHNNRHNKLLLLVTHQGAGLKSCLDTSCWKYTYAVCEGRNGMLVRFYLDTKTWARKQIPALGDEVRRKRSSICWVSDCQLVLFQLQHTVSQEDRKRLLPNSALQKKGHSVCYLVIYTLKMLFCLRFVSVVILYADI